MTFKRFSRFASEMLSQIETNRLSAKIATFARCERRLTLATKVQRLFSAFSLAAERLQTPAVLSMHLLLPRSRSLSRSCLRPEVFVSFLSEAKNPGFSTLVFERRFLPRPLFHGRGGPSRAATRLVRVLRIDANSKA